MLTGSGEDKAGNPLLFLGLSSENIRRLTGGEPILVPASRLVKAGLPPISVAIVFGDTEDAIAAELIVAQGTQVHDD
jgi:hypothetical protein